MSGGTCHNRPSKSKSTVVSEGFTGMHQPIPPPMRTLQALVLDLDGTLLDTAPGLTEALNRALSEMGRSPLQLVDVKPMIGDGVDTLIERAAMATGGPLTPASFAEIVGRYRALMRDAPPPATFPGVRAALGKLNEQGVKLAVCTNKPEAAAREVLDRTQLISFLDTVIGADAAPLKPDPTMVRRALAVLGAEASSSALVGDSEVDVATARAAELPVVLLAHGYVRGTLADAGADATARGFADLPAALGSLGFQIGISA
jgi:phosphoglycolate phosphatase